MKTNYNLTDREFKYFESNCGTTEKLVDFFEKHEDEDVGDIFKNYIILNKRNVFKLWDRREEEGGDFEKFVGFLKEINNMDF